MHGFEKIYSLKLLFVFRRPTAGIDNPGIIFTGSIVSAHSAALIVCRVNSTQDSYIMFTLDCRSSWQCHQMIYILVHAELQSGRNEFHYDRSKPMNCSLLRLLLALCLCLTISPSFAGGLAERVQEHTLANGMKLLLVERHTSPTVAAWIRFKVGSCR